MELKKAPKIDLERMKGLFFQIGLVVALGIVFAAFEWPSKAVRINYLDMPKSVDVEIDMVPVTEQIQEQRQTPPPPPAVQDIMLIIDDDSDLDSNIDFNSEMTGDEDITFVPVIETEPEVIDVDPEIFVSAEIMPEYPGGQMALLKFLANNVKYPISAQENGIFGRVFVSFVIDRTGEITNVRVARPVNPDLDKEAIRVVKSMPRWTPGYQQGRPVNVSYTVPINFVLN